ncbi:HK97 family phage prohead protease [Magnetococcus sp. PR-3]|uniref:HK97 family phage prohead protease n=1 Tax=Magnetococcus sp. PR-3 TaxID=3120355 RepID=UPI002FCE2E33
MSKNLERRAFAFDLSVEERGDGKKMIRGHAAVFNKLSENLGGFREQIAPGAFDDVLNDDVRALINHDGNLILGRTVSGTLRINQDANGLSYELDPPDTQYARDLLVSLLRGDITQSSFAFTVDEEDWDEDGDGRVIRTIQKVKRLYDVSPVTYPAYPDATVGLRSMETWQSVRNKRLCNRASVSMLRRRLTLAQSL